jgi:hypothetical protein
VTAQQGLTCSFKGRLGLEPRTADYESSQPAAGVRLPDLGRHELTRSCLHPFRHVFGMIKLDTGRYR